MIRPDALAPSQSNLRVVGAFNPGVVAFGQETILLVRVAEQAVETREGAEAAPRYDPDTGALHIDWVPVPEEILH